MAHAKRDGLAGSVNDSRGYEGRGRMGRRVVRPLCDAGSFGLSSEDCGFCT